MKGIIALDIDGTVTPNHHPIAPEVIHYLSQLHASGWQLIFITGRTFNWGYTVLKNLPFPYTFAVQNGAILLQMPVKKIIAKHYLDRSILSGMEAICEGEATDFVVYGGYEYQDLCYYRPAHFSSELNQYLAQRRKGMEEIWEVIDSFTHLPWDSFPSIKCFGNETSLTRIVEKIDQHPELGLHVPIIKDPFFSGYYVAQATHPLVNKGHALRDFIELIGNQGPVIAAGDDNNDETMFNVADIKVVMETAPKHLLQSADVIAPSAEKQGIIQGLQAALTLCSKGNNY